ncbi:response regulator [bacterium]|nr:response regulator [bacterium]
MNSSGNIRDARVNIESRHILLLDDELAVRVALARVLKRNGYQCTTAHTGEEALEIVKSAILKNTHFDLAILDIKIFGGMDGIETMQKMKDLGSKIPMISMSGYDTEDLFSSDKDRTGFAGHLQKPFDKFELLNEIERFCPLSS